MRKKKAPTLKDIGRAMVEATVAPVIRHATEVYVLKLEIADYRAALEQIADRGDLPMTASAIIANRVLHKYRKTNEKGTANG